MKARIARARLPLPIIKQRGGQLADQERGGAEKIHVQGPAQRILSMKGLMDVPVEL